MIPPLIRSLRRARATTDGLRVAERWSQADPVALDEYLVSGYQNPRINVQSILTRHALVRARFGLELDALMSEELEFCTEAVETIRVRARELGITMGSFLDPVKRAAVQQASQAISHWEGTYEQRWAGVLAGRRTRRLAVLELACGSANDYRFFDSYGIAGWLNYTGVDLARPNIDNARRRHPGVRFEVLDILNLPYRSGGFDHVIASDVFEHLPVPAAERAIGRASRLARKGVVLNFFRMGDQPDHDPQVRGGHHRNLLSAPRIVSLLRQRWPAVTAIPVRDFLASEVGYRRWYNERAWTIVAHR